MTAGRSSWLTQTLWTAADTAIATSVAEEMGYEVEETDETDLANINMLARCVAKVRRETIEACIGRVIIIGDVPVVHLKNVCAVLEKMASDTKGKAT